MALAKRDEGAKVNSNINVTPMVDVMLVLLIIFMVITPMLQKGVSVDLARTNNPVAMQDAEKEDALLVARRTHAPATATWSKWWTTSAPRAWTSSAF
jgi:biopolymer transport protein ExbD/biopolymer transport protein TolR